MQRQSLRIGKLIIAIAAACYFFHYIQTAGDWHFLDNLDLIIHEAGHVVFFLFGHFLYVLGGSLFQILVPIVFSSYFFLRGQYYSGSLLLYWVGENIINVSIYAGDAIAMQLPLLGGDSSGHDWNNILTMLHALSYTPQIAGALYALGCACIGIAAMLTFLFAVLPERVNSEA